MRTPTLILFGFVTLLLWGAMHTTVLANTSLYLDAKNMLWTLDETGESYDPFRKDLQYLTLYITLYYTSAENLIGTLSAKSIDTTFRDLKEPTPIQRVKRVAMSGNHQLQYGLYDSPLRQEILQGTQSDIGETQILSLSLPANQNGQIQIPIHMVVFPGQVVPPGRYEDTLRLSLSARKNSMSQNLVRNDKDILVQIDVGQALRYTPMRDTLQGAQELHLDKQDVTATYSMVVQSNTPYTLKLSSAHLGYFQHSLASRAVPMRYRLSLNDTPIPLTDTPSEKVWTLPPTPFEGVLHRFEFYIPYDKQLLSGRYIETFFYEVYPTD